MIGAIGMVAAALVALPMCSPSVVPAPAVEVIAWCGVNPADGELAWQQARSLAVNSGVDATAGPCLRPPVDYSPARPGSRYADPLTYLELVVINAHAGMKTIVYDPRVWGTLDEREDALNFWWPHRDWLYAFDLGDEYMPQSADWAALVARWHAVRTLIEPVIGVGPFTNHVGTPDVVETALRDLDGQSIELWFDLYIGPDYGQALAKYLNGQVKTLGCAVNAQPHIVSGQFEKPGQQQVRSVMQQLRSAGCDKLMIFGGAPIVDTPGYESPSLVTRAGKPTPVAAGVLQGAR